ncbi:MAG TPA: carboxypeptidase regulatory-like domain-containing protein [Vicinamibacterales bacterium]|nr:carboxypeptidase regulatory-like domain-containing protein [Vicinamibacterales bacterium]
MRILSKLGALAGALVLLVPSMALAQASITGNVKDTSGAVLPGVTVEAASPVLIEKARSVVTDSNGRYQIVDLRPGTYTVTFTLAGFNTFKREGVVLSGASANTVDADLRVGSLEETITVTGEAPVVDTHSLTKQQVLSSDVVDALPSARNYVTLGRMVSGTNATGNGANDVGGSLIQDVGGSLTVHGSRATDQRVTANGINTMTLQAGGNIGGQTPDVGSAAEVSIDTTSLSADLPTGGVRINFIPRDGGNRFANSAFFTFANKGLQGNNFSDELKAAGLATPTKIVSNFDFNEAFGGPMKKDKVWFWFSTRYNVVKGEAGIFTNANAFKVNEWLYVPTTTPAVNEGQQFNNSLRVTWQVNPKVKVAGTYKADKWCNCPNQISATRAPEAARDRRFPRLRQEHAEVTSPLTNKLLFEAVGLHLFERWGDMHLRAKGGSLDDPSVEALLPSLISVTEQSNNLIYRGREINNNTLVPNFSYRAAMSYVTGTHAFKVGFNRTHGFLEEYQYAMNPVSYRFNLGVPNQITLMNRPYTAKSNMDNDFGLFAQDRWTMDRLTLNLALRFDAFQTSFPEQTVGPAPLVPTRNITFPETDNLNWKDITYRTGLVYDLGGNGKTAIKAALNKYLLGQTLNGIGRNPNPVLALTQSVNRSWTDTNGDFVPQCDLLNPLANNGGDACGQISDLTFGTNRAGELYDKDLTTGWGHRPSNWEFSVGVQRELIPRVALDVGYFRRVWKNFEVVDNLLVTPADFTRFSLTVPTDPRLSTSGQTLSGLYNVVPTKFGQVQNLHALSDNYGKQIDHWNGFDISVNARLQNGLTLQGGMGAGKQIEDNCEIVAALPEMLNLSAADATAASTTGAPGHWRPADFCHREQPMLTGFKALAIYIIPKIDVQISGSFRSTPGTTLTAAYTATNAILGTSSTLGRALSGNAANMVVNIEQPNETFTERRNELDMRIGKVLKFGNTKTVVSMDLYNALNSNAMIVQNQAYASYLNPVEILNARLIKFSWAFDF